MVAFGNLPQPGWGLSPLGGVVSSSSRCASLALSGVLLLPGSGFVASVQLNHHKGSIVPTPARACTPSVGDMPRLSYECQDRGRSHPHLFNGGSWPAHRAGNGADNPPRPAGLAEPLLLDQKHPLSQWQRDDHAGTGTLPNRCRPTWPMAVIEKPLTRHPTPPGRIAAWPMAACPSD